MQKREVKAILFDLDGVLVNSEDAWYHTYNDMIATYGIKAISRKEFSSSVFNLSSKNKIIEEWGKKRKLGVK